MPDLLSRLQKEPDILLILILLLLLAQDRKNLPLVAGLVYLLL